MCAVSAVSVQACTCTCRPGTPDGACCRLQVFEPRLCLPHGGRLCMEDFARRLVEAPVCSISIERCTLRRPGGGSSKQSLAHMARYIENMYGHLVSVRLTGQARQKKECCVLVDKV